MMTYKQILKLAQEVKPGATHADLTRFCAWSEADNLRDYDWTMLDGDKIGYVTKKDVVEDINIRFDDDNPEEGFKEYFQDYLEKT